MPLSSSNARHSSSSVNIPRTCRMHPFAFLASASRSVPVNSGCGASAKNFRNGNLVATKSASADFAASA